MTTPDEADPVRRSHVGLISSGIALVTPPLYVLSLGPVAWLFEREFLSDTLVPTAVMFYWPLFWAMDHSVLLEECMTWYVEFWVL